MRSQLPEDTLVSLLRQCYITPQYSVARRFRQTSLHLNRRALHTSRTCRHSARAQCSTYQTSQHRPYLTIDGSIDNANPFALQNNSSNSSQGPNEVQIAVLGGGITGLASAFYLTRQLPTAKITVYEGSDRLGGWLNSKHVNVATGSVVMEQGPRTLRPTSPAGMVTLELIAQLGLEDQLLVTPKSSIAAQNRFLYYPDHLVRMPGPGQDIFEALWTVLTEPIFRGLPLGMVLEATRPTRPLSLEDESVASFLERRLGTKDIGDNIVSGIVHGIYGGDIYQLSIRSLFPTGWHLEALHGSISAGLLKSQGFPSSLSDVRLMDEMVRRLQNTSMFKMLDGVSVYTFKNGIGAFSEALESSLRANPNVQFKLGHEVSGVEYDKGADNINITTSKNHPPSSYSNVISTIPGRYLPNTLKDPWKLSSLQDLKSVTVMIVNLYYTDPDLLAERGFGYLIPRSIAYEQNPECALGVVFDSDATAGQDSAPGTKLTVMLGGHWWDHFSSYPDEDEGAAMAKAVLKRHLKIDQEPAAVNVALQKDCIPQYTVGHHDRMVRADAQLMENFGGRLAVAGSSYTGVGVNDCVRAAMDVVLFLTANLKHPEHPKKTELNRATNLVTGLEWFRNPPLWIVRQV